MENKDKKKTDQPAKKEKSTPRKIMIKEGTNIKDLADLIDITSKELLSRLIQRGLDISVNDIVSEGLAGQISKELGMNVSVVPLEEELRTQAEKSPKELVLRPPVVTMMGHVDHGKTTLLDAIRQSNLVSRESGGITQHIGAYRVWFKDRPITFIDTPGHEAFTKLRARGANVTDIVVLVVAADDGVMPQTREAINHAKAAKAPIIVAINKMDRPEADAEKVKQTLSKEGLLVEEWGGDVISIEVSATEKINLDELLEMILLLSDVVEIKANLDVQAQGVVLEARLDSKKGPVATVIIQHGTLTPGEAFICGLQYGRVRAMFDEHG